MVFTTGSLQTQHSIHRRHLLESIFPQLRPSRARRCIPARAADDQSPSLASKPTLTGPPKRNARPTPPPAPPNRFEQDPSRPRYNGPGGNGNRSFNDGPQQHQNPRERQGDGQTRRDFDRRDNRQFNRQDSRYDNFRQDRQGFQGRQQDPQDRQRFQGSPQDQRPGSPPPGGRNFPPQQSRGSAEARQPQQPQSAARFGSEASASSQDAGDVLARPASPQAARSSSQSAPAPSTDRPSASAGRPQPPKRPQASAAPETLAKPQRPRPPPASPDMLAPPARPRPPNPPLNRPSMPRPQDQRQELRASSNIKSMDRMIDRLTDPHRRPPPQQRPSGPASPLSWQSSDQAAQPSRDQYRSSDQGSDAALQRPQRPQAGGQTLAPPPRPQTADAPTLAPRPGLRPGPSRPGPSRQGSIDIDRYAASRGRQNQNRSMDGQGRRPEQGDFSGNGALRPPPRRPGAPAQGPPAGRQAQPDIPGMPVPAQGKPAGKARKKRGPDSEQDDESDKQRGRGRKSFAEDGRQFGRARAPVKPSKPRETKAERKQRREDAEEKLVKEEIIEVGLEGMSVEELGRRIAVDPEEIVVALFMKGVAAQVNQVLDFETVQIAAEDFEVEIIEKDEAKIDDAARKTMDYMDEKDLEHLQPRPPVVVVMGHVDHGKTSLLDTIRKSKVAAGEAGGITQAIGAYTVPVDTDADVKAVTFLDTPGHEAFSAMRARGARVTDIAIIVVAADDGVRPQTLEAVSHAKAAGVPIVVAINKIDKDGANPERVKQEMSEAGLLPEEWGGKVPFIPISAKKGTGVDDLLETVALVAEVEQLMSNPTKPAAGTVLEAHLDRRIGAIATLLVQTGTLKVGDVVVAGAAYGKVRSMKDNVGDKEEASASTAVQMSGLHAVPVAGDDFTVATSLDEGRKLAEAAGSTRRIDRLSLQAGGGSMITTSTTTQATMDGDDEEDSLQRFNVILKADASGSLEAVKAALNNLPQGSVVLRYLLALPNEITESDVDLAAASQGLILGFNVEPSEAVQTSAKHQGVTIQTYKVIYNLLDDMRAAMEGKLTALEQRVPIGAAEVRAVFGKGSKLVAGCMVTDGLLREDSFIVVTRKKKTVFEGNLSSLRRVKEIVKSVENGNECGVGCKDFIGWEDGDKIEAFELVNRRRTLEDKVAPRAFQVPDEWAEEEEKEKAENPELVLQGR